MKRLLLCLLLPCLVHAQPMKGYYEDYLRNTDGTPQINVLVQNSTTMKRTYTDKQGFFQLQAKVGDIVRIQSNNGIKDITIEKGMLYADLAKQNLPVPTAINPITSNDYLDPIKYDNKDKKLASIDALIDAATETLQMKGSYNSYSPIQQAKVVNGKLKLVPAYAKRLSIGGTYNSSIEIRTVNRLPALQSTYAQGSSQNGAIVYRGPETNELFSYGPTIQSLEFDGSPYAYDVNGKLVATGTGNGIKAGAYNNSVFRTAASFAQSLTVQANLVLSPKRSWNFSMKLGEKKENTFIQYNRNTNQNMALSIGSSIGWLNVSASYSYFGDRFSNSNRNGFLNRVYQQASLTPISFENAQGNRVGNNQRSYSNLADNPYFLLMDNGNAFHQSQNIAGLSFEKKRGKLLFKLDQSIEDVLQQGNEMYKAGTAYFINGISTERNKHDRGYFLKANTSFSFGSYHFKSTFAANYIYNTARTTIDYTEGLHYNYQRSAHDIGFSYQANYQEGSTNTGAGIGNKLYLSNTSNAPALLLPSLSAYFRQNDIFDISKLSCKLYSTYNVSKAEPAISNSLAQVNLLQYTAQQSMQYFPLTEVDSYDNLQPIHQDEFKLGLEISYGYRLTLTGEFFAKQTKHDVFPLYNNGKLMLQNIASHQTRGVELQLTYSSKNSYQTRKISNSNSLSFFAYHNKVTAVEDGFNNTPMAGFSNVYKAIVKGQPLGVIVGNSFLRNADNRILIGADGFPLVNNQATVLGNPIPDFVVKMSNGFSWKKLTMSLDWEWSKGGDRWNGTQAALDYYGRSQSSADWRNTTNYVFDGAMQNGQHNTVPVNFYDASLPVQQNRWTRYGPTGVAEEYMEKADCIRLRLLSLTYKWEFKKYIQKITLGTYINNIVLWTAYKGTDPNQLLFDQPNTSGLDYFNLPSTKNIGINLTIQF